MALDLTRLDPLKVQSLVQACTSRMETMRGYRVPWWAYWSQIAESILPWRYRFFITPNQYSRGGPLNQAIIDETGFLAARTLATGLLSGLISPDKPWFRLGIANVEYEDIPEGPVKQWLAECTRRILEVYAQSNFYQAHGQMLWDNVVFGSSPVIQYEDREDVVRFYVPELGSFMFGLSNRLEVDTLYREYTYTISETVKEFGMENLSVSSQTMAKSPSSLDTEIVIKHVIEPNSPLFVAGQDLGYLVPKAFPYREVYWEGTTSGGAGTQGGKALRIAGFREQPFTGFRWDVTSNDPYGRSPGMSALPAIRQLQIEQKRKAEAIDKMVRPPMVASVSMKNEPMDILPGGVSYVMDPAGSGFKPAFTVEPRIQEMMVDIQEVQSRVKDIFFNNLFSMFTPDMTVQTATWVDAAMAEKLVLLGPVIGRMESEGFDQTIERTFAVMDRRGLLPPVPPELEGMPIAIQYISMLAEAQRASATSGIERWVGFAGNLVGVKPDVLDNINLDRTLATYGDLLMVDPDLANSPEQVAAIRQARDAQEAAAASLQVGMEAVNAGKTLSETQVGEGGGSALDAILGTA